MNKSELVETEQENDTKSDNNFSEKIQNGKQILQEENLEIKQQIPEISNKQIENTEEFKSGYYIEKLGTKD